MKHLSKFGKRTLSVLLCLVMLVTAAPVLDISSFITKTAAASYSKKFASEYYFASGTTFISYIAVGVKKASVEDRGYTRIDKDLNDGAGGSFLWLGYKTSGTFTEAIRDIRVYNGGFPGNTYSFNNSTYTVTGQYPTSATSETGEKIYAVDLNKGAGGSYLYCYATKNAAAGAPITEITVNETENESGWETVKFINSGSDKQGSFTTGTNVDANRDAGGDYIWIHIKRLPTVDTTGLRSAMESADTYLAKSGRYTSASVTTLQNAKDTGQTIINDYDNDSYSTSYNQTAIDNAKNAIWNAINGLVLNQHKVSFNLNYSGANQTNFFAPYFLNTKGEKEVRSTVSEFGYATYIYITLLTIPIQPTKPMRPTPVRYMPREHMKT